MARADATELPLRELRFAYSRSSGPGGQNVNKVNTRVTLRWNVVRSTWLRSDRRERFLERFASRITGDGELLISSQRFRDRGRNTADCIERLRALLREVERAPTPRRATRPGPAAERRRLADKRRRALRKRERRRPRDGD